MKDQQLKFEPLAIFGHIKRVYCSNLALEAQVIQIFIKNGLPFQLVECTLTINVFQRHFKILLNQHLKFEQVAKNDF